MLPVKQTPLCSSLPHSACALEIREMAPASDLVLVYVQGNSVQQLKKVKVNTSWTDEVNK